MQVSETKLMKDHLTRVVKKLETACPYADATFFGSRKTLLVKDKTGIDNHSEADAGVKIRAFDGQRWHESCLDGWNPDALHEETQRMLARLKESPCTKPRVLKVDRKQADTDTQTRGARDLRTVPPAQMLTTLNDAYDRIIARCTGCQASLGMREEHRVFVNRYKRLSSTWTGCTFTIVPFVTTSAGETRHDFFRRFANGFEATEIPAAEFDAMLSRAVRLRSAKRITPGAYTVITSPNVTGLLAHESFGHGMEADVLMHGRARAADYLGKRIASAKVSIADDPSLPGAFGSIAFDDEGQLPERTLMVERGIVKDPITDLHSASVLGTRRTANGRAEGYDHKIFARMTNTFFLPGKETLASLLKEVKDGYYLHHGSSGIEDPKGWGVQIAGVLCERIKNGKLTGELYAEASITGFLPDLMANITGVSSEFSIINDAGMCAKGHKDWVRVASGGPHLLIRKVQLS